jgi:hypothetical protein
MDLRYGPFTWDTVQMFHVVVMTQSIAQWLWFLSVVFQTGDSTETDESTDRKGTVDFIILVIGL